MAWLLNVVLPGTGLIIRRREWLGFSLAMVFGVCGNVALAGWLIAPVAVPFWLTWLAGGLCALSWLLAQLLMQRQVVLLRRRAGGIVALLREAQAAIEVGDLKSASLALERGAAMDDENVELYVLRARLCALEEDVKGERAAWRRVVKLDRQRRYGNEARRALADA